MKQKLMIPRLAIVLAAISPAVSFAASPLGNELQINQTTDGPQQAPRIAFNAASDGYVVVWQSFSEANGNDVFARRYDAEGAPLGDELQLNTTTSGDQANPVPAPLPAGGFAVFWESLGQDGESFGVFGRRLDGTGAPAGAEFQVNLHTQNSQETPEICSDPSGQVLAVWESRDQDGENAGIFGRRYDAALNPLGGEFQVNTFTQSLQGAPRIACSPVSGGERLVMWESLGQEGQPDRGIFAQRLAADGSPLGAEFQVNDYVAYNQSVPSAGIDAAGRFVVAWGSNTQDGEGMGVFLRRFAADAAPLGDEEQVNSFIFDRQRNPRIAMQADGRFVVAWESYNQEGRRKRWGSFAQQFSSDGSPLGREFLVNSYVRRSQGDPDVAVNPADGSFFVVWNSELQDGADFGVFGQRFADPQLCAPAPRTGCVASGRAGFRMRNDGCDDAETPCSIKNTKDLIQWKWARPAGPHTVSPYGNDDLPESGDEEALALCIYDESAGSPSLAGSIYVPPSGTCFTADCWRGDNTVKYRDRDQSPHGVRKLIVGQKSVKFFARGPLVQPPVLPLALDPNVTIQLVSSGGDCIESVFEGGAATVIRNDLGGFQVRK